MKNRDLESDGRWSIPISTEVEYYMSSLFILKICSHSDAIIPKFTTQAYPS